MATISISKTGKYQVEIRKTGHKTLVKSFLDRKTALHWAKKTESQMENSEWVDYSTAKSVTLLQLMERYKLEILPSKRCQSIKSIIKMISEQQKPLAATSLINISPALIRTYMEWRLQSVATETVRKDLGFLQRLFNHAIKDWDISLPRGNPVEKVRFPATCKARTRRPTTDELTALEADKVIGAYVALAVETGMRRGEIAGIRSDHWNGDYLSIPKTKTDIPRVIPLTARAKAVLPSILDKPLRPDSISQGFIRACKRYSIQDLRFHDLRHEATSRFFELGLNQMEVASITGHQTLQMLKRYTHINPEILGKRLLSC